MYMDMHAAELSFVGGGRAERECASANTRALPTIIYLRPMIVPGPGSSWSRCHFYARQRVHWHSSLVSPKPLAESELRRTPTRAGRAIGSRVDPAAGKIAQGRWQLLAGDGHRLESRPHTWEHAPDENYYRCVRGKLKNSLGKQRGCASVGVSSCGNFGPKQIVWKYFTAGGRSSERTDLSQQNSTDPKRIHSESSSRRHTIVASASLFPSRIYELHDIVSACCAEHFPPKIRGGEIGSKENQHEWTDSF